MAGGSWREGLFTSVESGQYSAVDHAIWRGSGRIMGFREAVTVCIQDYYTFSGRARRPEFWWFILFITAGKFLLTAVDAVIFGEDMLLGISGLFWFLTLPAQLAVSWRRMHDTGRPGWFYLLPVIPVASLYVNHFLMTFPIDPAHEIVLFYVSIFLTIVVLVWLVLPSQPGLNRFGPEPPP